MEAYLICHDGTIYEIPSLLEWKFSYGCGLPCDAFEISFIYDKSILSALTAANRFRAEHEGETVFTGLVDDFEILISENGSLVTFNGRGLAALLLDNEAEAAQYYSASLDMMLEKYVYPLGLNKVKISADIPRQAFDIESGASHWKVLENFLWFSCGIKPRFSKDGVLLIGDTAGKSLSFDGSSAYTKQSLKRARYGVISEVLVKNKALGTSERVENPEFIQSGGCCRRVVNVPRKTRFDAMRATGEYQIDQSKVNELLISLTVPQIFAAFPGDTIEFSESHLGVADKFMVQKSCCFANGERAGTEITLTRNEV
ncbi:MAG: hypothetical protein EOM51_01705 [Clostridia bacterium]|nr:hypothetical protein [Clostridia bacterium]